MCKPNRFLILIPLALGLVLRLAELTHKPPGYAEHAAVHHALLSIPFHDDLRAAVFHADRAAFKRVWNGVVTDQHGPNSLVEALGFSVFGVNFTASRFTSAVLAALGLATSTHAYFDLTHAHETESHKYHQEMAKFVSGRLGSRYITIVVGREWDVDDVHRYLALAAYRTLSELAKRGAGRSTVYRVVKASELATMMPSLTTTGGRGLLLAEQLFVREPFEGVDLRALVAKNLPGTRASVQRADDGSELFTWWEFESHPGGPAG